MFQTIEDEKIVLALKMFPYILLLPHSTFDRIFLWPP